MASDLQNKFQNRIGGETPPHQKQIQIESSALSADSPFTPEQRRILGNVYQLILSWRNERLMKQKQSAIAPTSPIVLLPERESEHV